MQTKILKINPDFPEVNLIKEAALVLRQGGLVAFPTETVYGIGANLLDEKAVDKLYRIKKRPRNKPFTIQIAKFETLMDMGIVLTEEAIRIINRFWPGPLTIVAFNRSKEKIGIRMPSNKVALDLIREADVPLVVPSANISGNKAPVSATEVMSDLAGFIDIILDGGVTELGVESTVADVTTKPFTILRQGAVSKEDLLVDYSVLFVCTGNSCRSVMAKGMLEKFLKGSGLPIRVKVDSAGTATFSGITAAPSTIEVMREEGIDVSLHRGKPISKELLKQSDLIFVMERMHRNIILNQFPQVDSKVRFLKEDDDIPDPIGKSIEEYRRVLASIKDQVENIFLELFEKEK